MGLGEFFNRVFVVYAFADALQPLVMRHGIFGCIETTKGHIKDVGRLIAIEDADGMAVLHIGRYFDAVKSGIIAAPLGIGEDFSRQIV